MPNTLTTRMAVIETKFETVIEPMALQVQQIHDQMPEIVRKVDKHHEVFHEHSDVLRTLESAGCPAKKVYPEERKSDGNGGYLERRTKKSWRVQFKELSAVKKLSTLIIATPFFASYWEWLFDKAHTFLNWLEAIPK